MNWKNGFSGRYYMELVDTATWRDIQRIEITGGTISRSGGDLMEAADIDVTELPEGSDRWVRIYLDARQEDEGDRVAIFTGLLTAPSADWNGKRKSHRTECYSVLKPADDVLLQRGWYAPAGTNGAALAAELLSIGAAPVVYDDYAPTISETIVAEDGETNLSMARKIIDSIGWRIRISGNGEIRVCAKASEAAATFDALENDFVELQLSDRIDWFSCPNVFRAVSGDLTAVARDDDPDSPFSTVSRGREIWAEETNCTLNLNEGITEYALRRLKEEQSPARTADYARRFHPELTVGDIVKLHYPAQNIDSDFRIVSQNIELKYGARTSEEAEQV